MLVVGHSIKANSSLLSFPSSLHCLCLSVWVWPLTSQPPAQLGFIAAIALVALKGDEAQIKSMFLILIMTTLGSYRVISNGVKVPSPDPNPLGAMSDRWSLV